METNESTMSLYDHFKSYNAVKEGDTSIKNNLTYLDPYAAWEQVLKVDPRAEWSPVYAENGMLYHTDGKTAWVRVICRIHDDEGCILERQMHLPVMDLRNKSIPIEAITSFDVNKAIMRCLVKCLAFYGLGLNIYRKMDGMTEFDKDEIEQECIEYLDKCNTASEFQNVYAWIMQNHPSCAQVPNVSAAIVKAQSRVQSNNNSNQ